MNRNNSNPSRFSHASEPPGTPHSGGAITPGSPTVTAGGMKLLDQLRGEIRVRHYSIRTEHTYSEWVDRFIRFHKMRHPSDMGAAEINH